ncbi:MAG: hypothetical protein IKL98_06240 [Akkermansia sp.]|nr:hypothetical protein [Akkermansiaceae bacterium]MBR3695826.1 hypothetical protein [Akkermansia sp.]
MNLQHITKRPFIKVTGQTNAGLADCAMAFGARMLCFIFDRLNPRAISPERASDIPSHNIQRVGIFHESNADEVMQIMQQARLDFAQVADKFSTTDAERVGAQHIIRELRMARETSISYMQMQIDEWSEHCSFFLLVIDGNDIKQATALHFKKPWILCIDKASASMTEALRNCRPDGVELADSVEEAPGIQNAGKILQAIVELG